MPSIQIMYLLSNRRYRQASGQPDGNRLRNHRHKQTHSLHRHATFAKNKPAPFDTWDAFAKSLPRRPELQGKEMAIYLWDSPFSVPYNPSIPYSAVRDHDIAFFEEAVQQADNKASQEDNRGVNSGMLMLTVVAIILTAVVALFGLSVVVAK